MRFGKDFKKKSVPEWTEAYMDYEGLKKVLAELIQYKKENNNDPTRVEDNEIVIDFGPSQSDASGIDFVTNFLRQSEGGGDIEVRFFSMLDEELNKVNTFFKEKVEEVMQEDNPMQQQIDALVAWRSEQQSNVGACTKCITSNVRKDKELRVVFVVFYQKLYHMRLYSLLNLSAFGKILKKYDKISSRKAKMTYMTMVNNSYVGSSDEVTNLLKRVESIFIQHLSNSNRKKAMETLRPKAKKRNHGVGIGFGFFLGLSVAFAIEITRNSFERTEASKYMPNIFPLYSLFLYIFLHMITHAVTLYFWRKCRVNYPFIFGFEQGTELDYCDVSMLSVALSALGLACLLANMQIGLLSKTRHLKTAIELIPLVFFIVVLVIIIFPFNIVYRSSRFFLIRSLLRCISALFHKRATLPDFFLADHLTSQVEAIRCLELYICYYGLNDAEQRRDKCQNNRLYNILYFIVSVVPFCIRLMQCARRSYDHKDAVQAFNGLKYLLTIVAVVIRTAYQLRKGCVWFVLATLSSIAAWAMSIFWDIVMDWGLFRKKSKNALLRDKLLVPRKWVYYIAMGLNFALRLSWVYLLVDFNLKPLHDVVLTMVVSGLEIFRRGIWSFFRLENEHMNNVSMYHAFKEVPYPFSITDNRRQEDANTV